MDVKNDFLHGELQETFLMNLPQGYCGKKFIFGMVFEGECVAENSNMVCKMIKSLYELRQAPRQWYAKLSSAFITFGYIQSKVDYSLFTHSDTKGFIVILVYGDDLIVA